VNSSKSTRIRLILGSLLCLFLPSLSAQESSLEETFMRGNIAYGNADYSMAESAYREVLRAAQSSEVHYNLGNTLARQDIWSEAAFHYLRAYAMDPNASAAQANLLLSAERLNLDTAYPTLGTPANMLPERIWVIIAAVAFWIAILIFFQRDILSREFPLRKTLTILAVLGFLTSSLATIQHNLFDEWTIVSKPMASLRVAPAEQSPGESVLVEGDPVRILARQNGFYHVMTTNGDEGFLLSQEVYILGND